MISYLGHFLFQNLKYSSDIALFSMCNIVLFLEKDDNGDIVRITPDPQCLKIIPVKLTYLVSCITHKTSNILCFIILRWMKALQF